MTNVKLLGEAIKKSGLRRRFIADEMGIGYDRFYKKITGKIEFKASEVKAIADILKLSFDEMRAIFLS